jgi:hypothetical protein
MSKVLDPAQLSGWILPDGSWLEVDAWWHLNSLYDLRAQGRVAGLCDPEPAAILDVGDEAAVRDMAARLGFVKISRGEIDAYALLDHQLKTLQHVLEEFDPSFRFRLIIMGGERIDHVSIERIMKLRSARLLFASTRS